MFFAQSWENAVCIVFQQGVNTLCTFPQCFSHPAQRHSADLNWRSSLTLENAASVCICIEENDSTTQCFILNLTFYVFGVSLNLKIKEQPSDIVSERNETFGIYVFLHFFLVQVGAERERLSRHCYGLRNIFLFVRSPCVTLFCAFAIPHLVDGPHVIFNPQKLLMLQCPATGDPSARCMLMRGNEAGTGDGILYNTSKGREKV